MPFRVNYHTHTFRCHHASGDAIDYARVAAKAGMVALGISDHVPLPDHRWQEVRMAMGEIDEYTDAIDAARAAVPELTILTGAECEYDPAYHSFFQDELIGRRGFHYLIGASHFIEVDGRWKGSFEGLTNARLLSSYARQCVRTMESGLFIGLAHPDLIGNSNAEWTEDTRACAREICAAAAALRFPLELNSYGIRKPWIQSRDGARPSYPWPPFWRVAAEEGAPVMLSSDAHRPADVAAGYDELAAIRDRYQLVEIDPLAERVAALRAARD